MTAIKADKNELLQNISDAVSGIKTEVSSLSDERVNQVPFKDSWTAGQLVRHVTKSINGMAKALTMSAELSDRDPAARVPELEKTFLDFGKKMQSPEPVVPENISYVTQQLVSEIDDSFSGFSDAANAADLNQLIKGLPLGPITKLEILYFILYHTQRHAEQMRRICAAVPAIANK